MILCQIEVSYGHGMMNCSVLCLKWYVFGHGMLRREIWCPKRILCGHGMGEGKENGGWPVSLLFQTGFGLRHPRGRSPRGLLKADRCAAHNIFFAPFHPLCKRGLQRSVIAQKKDDAFASSCLLLSGKRGSNPRPSAWEADALPTELFPQLSYAVANVHNFFYFL